MGFNTYLDNPSEKTISESSHMKHETIKLSNEETSAQKTFKIRQIMFYSSTDKIEIYHVLSDRVAWLIKDFLKRHQKN